jgi:two-component system chemotaxis response regulator CheY
MPSDSLAETDPPGGLAARPQDAVTGATAAPPAGTGLSQVTILMLDDDPTMRTAVRTTLRAAGCQEVLQTGNGHEALNMVARNKIDLILCDCQMPAMDGMTFLRLLRDTSEGAKIPVLMLTVNQNAKDAWEAQQLNVAGWLVKPVAPQNVAAQVAATLGKLPPRVQENLLAQLVESYEAELPNLVAKLHGQATAWMPDATDFTARLQELYRRMHQVRGQAGPMGYALLGDVAGLLHDVMCQAVDSPVAAEQHRAELVKLGRVGISGMKLVADRRLRGDGGAAGARMKQQIGDFAAALQAQLEAAAPARAASRRRC